MSRGARSRPDRRSLAGSLAIHGLVLVLAWATTAARPIPVDFVSYEIQLVSPPAQVEAEVVEAPPEELVVERPEPPPPEDPVPDPMVEDEEPPPPPPSEDAPPPTENAAEATQPDPEDARVSGEDLNVRMEGIRRDYPAYYNNIIRQMRRCFRWPARDSWEATIYFVIEADGRVSDLEVLRPSGNPAFDIQGLGAAECAGKGRLGPLPEDLPFDRLPVQFRIRPDGGVGDLTIQAQEAKPA